MGAAHLLKEMMVVRFDGGAHQPQNEETDVPITFENDHAQKDLLFLYISMLASPLQPVQRAREMQADRLPEPIFTLTNMPANAVHQCATGFPKENA